MRERLRRNPAFPVVGIEGVLRDRLGNATGAGEDFADVIRRLAPGVGHISSKTMERAHLDLILQTIVFGPRTVVADAQVGKVTVHAARSIRIAGSSGLGGGARGDTRRDQAGSLNR